MSDENAFPSQARLTLPERATFSSVFLLAGLFMQFNGYVAGFRYSDISCAIFICVSIFFAARRVPVLLSVAAASISINALLLFSVIDFYSMKSNDYVWIIRCQMAIVFGAFFYFSTDCQRTKFCLGMVIGGFAGFLIALLEYAGLSSALSDYGLRSTTAASRGLGIMDHLGLTVRTTGMWGDANEFGPVSSLAVVAALFMLHRIQRAGLLLWVCIWIAVLNTFFLSFNRSSLIAVFTSVMTYFLKGSRRKNIGSALRFTLAALVLGSIIWVAFPKELYLIQDRYNFDTAAENLNGRLMSLNASMRLIWEYPFGLSSEVWPDILRSLSWVANPHNGFLSTIFGAGVLFGCFSFLAMIYCLISRDEFCRIFALHVSILFLFETLNFSPGLVYLLGIFWMRPVIDIISFMSRGHTERNLQKERELLLSKRVHRR